MTVVQTSRRVAGLRIVDARCPKCASAMYVKAAPCFMRKLGWATAIKCVRCGHQAGYQQRRRTVA